MNMRAPGYVRGDEGVSVVAPVFADQISASLRQIGFY
jgi:hypothetical protein